MLRKIILALGFLLVATPAMAQWQVPSHTVPIGRGGGVTGFFNTGTGSAHQVLTSNGASADPTWQSGGGTVTSITAGTGLTGGTITTSGTIALDTPVTVSHGGTGLTGGTSGGVPYFASASSMASSLALTANRIVLGGGAGAAPVVAGSLGTATTLLHGDASGPPTFSAVTNADLVNSATTVNGQTCTLGSTCTVTAPATGITVGTTTISGGANGSLEYNNSGVLGELARLPTSNLPTGTSGYALMGNGVSSPSYKGFVQSGTGAVTRTWQSKASDTISVLDYGAACDGSTDDTTAIQAAIDAATSAGGGQVTIPAAVCKLTGTLNITGDGVWLVGQSNIKSVLRFANGSADSIKIGFQVATVYGGGLLNLEIDHSSKTGGNAVSLQNISLFNFQNVTVSNAWNGILAYITNTVSMANVLVTGNVAGSSYGIKWSAPGDNSARSDVLYASNVVVNMGFGGGDCFDWDGQAQTLSTSGLHLLHCNYGLRVTNSTNSASYYPAFGQFSDLETDGTVIGVSIEAGSDFNFVNSDIDNNYASGTIPFQVLADATHSVTRSIRLAASSIHSSNNGAAKINARAVTIAGVQFYDTNHSGSGTAPVIEIQGASDNVTISGSLAGVRYGDPNTPSYGVKVDTGATNVSLLGNNYNGAGTGSIQDATGLAFILGGIGYDGKTVAGSNVAFNNVLTGYRTTATAGATTTLTVGSTYLQYFTGTQTQTVQLPVASTLVLGQSYRIVNQSSQPLTVNSSGGNLVLTVPPGAAGTAVCILISGTSAASWSSSYQVAGQREVLSASRTYDVGVDIPTPTISIASPAVVSSTAHGLSAGDAVVFNVPLNTKAATISAANPAVVTMANTFVAGQPVKFASTGSLPYGIVPGTTYYVISGGLSSSQFEFSATVGGSAVDTTPPTAGFTNGSANITITTANTYYSVGQTVRFATTGGLPTNFAVATDYYIVSASSTLITVSATNGGSAILAGSAGTGTQTALQSGTHYNSTTGLLPTGITEGTVYYVSITSLATNSFTLADTQAHALAGTGAINTSGSVTGSPIYNAYTGSDSNNGLTQTRAGAFLTPQKAVDTIAALDVNANSVTTQLANGTYTSGASLKNVVGFAAAGSLIIKGSSATPSNVLVSVTSNQGFQADGISSVWDIRDLKIVTISSGNALISQNGALLRFQNLDFGACADSHMRAQNRGGIVVTNNYAVSGPAVFHMLGTIAGFISVGGKTVTISGDPAITYFGYAEIGSVIYAASNTYTGTTTGTRYTVTLNSVIHTNGGGANYFPGSIAGATATGGQYD